MSNNDVCKEWIYRGRGRSGPCGRPVKEDGLCGLHAAAKHRREENAERRDRQYDESEQQRKAARQFLDDNGLPGEPEYACQDRNYTGRVVVDPADLIAWRDRAVVDLAVAVRTWALSAYPPNTQDREALQALLPESVVRMT